MLNQMRKDATAVVLGKDLPEGFALAVLDLANELSGLADDFGCDQDVLSMRMALAALLRENDRQRKTIAELRKGHGQSGAWSI